MKLRTYVLALVALGSLGACTDFDALEAKALCEQFARCDSGGADGGGTDAGNGDAGEGDAGAADAGVGDAGFEDAGVVDAGVDAGLDAGRTDGGAGDGGAVDAGNVDAGVLDAGSRDGGPLDAGNLDAGTRDAGLTPRQLDLRVRWYRTHVPPVTGSPNELGGYVVTSTDGGRVFLFSNTASADGRLFGNVYGWDSDTGASLLVDGGFAQVGTRATADSARAYTEGRITGASAFAGSFFLSFEGRLLDGGLPPTIGHGDFVRRYPVDTFPLPDVQFTAAGFTDIPSAMLRTRDNMGQSVWYVVTRQRGASDLRVHVGAPGLAFVDVGVSLALPCDPPSQAVASGAEAVALARCAGGTSKVLRASPNAYTLDPGPDAGPAYPVLAQAPDGTSTLPPLMAWADPVTNEVWVQELVGSGANSVPRIVATTSAGFHTVAMAVDSQRQAYLLGRLPTNTIIAPSLTPAGASFLLIQPWVVLALSSNLQVRWAAGLTIPESFDSHSIAVGAGRLFIEARCAGFAMIGTADGGFCEAGSSNVVVRLEAADGGAL